MRCKQTTNAALLLHPGCFKGCSLGQGTGREETLLKKKEKPETNHEGKARLRITEVSLLSTLQFHSCLTHRKRWNAVFEPSTTTIKSFGLHQFLSFSKWLRRSLKDEFCFQEICLKLQGTPSAVATASEVASLPHKAGSMNKFRQFIAKFCKILLGVIYSVLTEWGRTGNKKQHHSFCSINFP